MKAKLIFILIVLANTIGFSQLKSNDDSKKDRLIVYLLKGILTQGHYVEKHIDDNFSEYVFNEFINQLDPSKRYFTQEDIKEFSQFKYEIDDQLNITDISFYNLVYNRFLEKIKLAKTTYRTLLQHPFDYNIEEDINLDFENLPFAKDDKKLVEQWRKKLKLNVLSRINEIEKEEQGKLKKDKNYKIKTFETIENLARTDVLKNMDDLYVRIEELDNNDWFTTFLNTVVEGFDPHTAYMSPKLKSRFDQSMSGKLEGIGARLTKEGIYTEIVELISGGPAWKQGELEPGDKILKVAQGDKEPLDIVGMRLDDAINYIKGKKGTEVRLTVKKKLDGSTKVIPIIRDIVELEETFVKSSIVTKNGKKYGIINLPQFYIDFKDHNGRSASSDMKLEIERLKKENIEGLIVDLRNNGGGSLRTAIEIGGLFIKEGPIVQVKYRDKKAKVKEDTDPTIQWDKPLVILVNELSASASEIFAAAMQDYGRAVIMGSHQTYGKGTVQNIIPLNYYVKNFNGDLGSLKLTIQKFYRINGGSTQIEGVYSDVPMPTKYTYMKHGERDLKNPLKWDKVSQTDFEKKSYYTNLDKVIKNSKDRIHKSSKFNSIDSYAKWLKSNQDNNIYSLNYKKFIANGKIKEIQGKDFKDILKYESNLNFNSPKYEVNLFKQDTVLKNKRKRWHKNLKEDIYIDEALNVLSELEMKK